MTTPPLTELTDRTRDIFRLVVEQYLSTGQPVGSKTLSQGGAVDLSPASIRSVLADLEKLGLLAAPLGLLCLGAPPCRQRQRFTSMQHRRMQTHTHTHTHTHTQT